MAKPPESNSIRMPTSAAKPDSLLKRCSDAVGRCLTDLAGATADDLSDKDADDILDQGQADDRTRARRR